MGPFGKVLFVDDEVSMRESISQYLDLAGFDVEDMGPEDDILGQLSPDFAGIMVTDVKMPGVNGLDLMRQALAIDPELPVIVITGHGDVAMAVEAMRDGAYDFVEKPFAPDRIANSLKRACEKRQLVLELRQLRQGGPAGDDLSRKLIGNSPQMQRIREDIRYLADSDSPVLIHGETGSGKEVVARCLHEAGSRSKANFVPVNSAAIPENLMESELFGNEAGAFTGAGSLRIGRIEHADKGTLFLDEIESMPLSLQSKLLRALEYKTIERLGSNRQIPVDIRIVSASKADLLAESQLGRFRQDLFYRLNVTELFLPPLRDRTEDISLLFEYFLDQFRNDRGDKEAIHLSRAESQALLDYDWPGNVRELRNSAERFLLARHRDANIRLDSLIGRSSQPLSRSNHSSLADQMRQLERSLIADSLRRHNGQIQNVMEELDLPRRTLNEKMQKLDLKRDEFRNQS